MREFKNIRTDDIKKTLKEFGYNMNTKVMAWCLTTGEKFYNCSLKQLLFWYGKNASLVRYKVNNSLGFKIKAEDTIYFIEFVILKNPNNPTSQYLFKEYIPLV